LRLSKQEILEAYLTFTPYGRNVEGIEAASLAYFGHSADHLTLGETATLLAVPQNPTRRYPTVGHEATLTNAREKLAQYLIDDGQFSLEAEVPRGRVPTGLRPMPRDVPHAALWLKARNPGVDRISSTLDPGVQRLAEASLERVAKERSQQGIHNASIVVLEHETGEIRALVGSMGFWDDAHGGQIAMFDVARSPGSALKPFIYAMAIDKGVAIPDRLVADVPMSFGTYAPKNYDDQFSGLVPMEESLSRSLNLPFVVLLRKIGVEPFIGVLRQAGASHLSPHPGHYGLSVAAGGIEITPLELAGLYGSLAHGGRFVPPTLVAGSSSEGVELFSPGSAWLVHRALTIRDRPDFPSRRSISEVPRDIAWKTGTSFGHRDAWASGWAGAHTAVVWMGNVDQAPSHSLVGADAAGPVLFDLLEGLNQKRVGAKVVAQPEDLQEIEVCSLSGHVPGRACPHRKKVLARTVSVPPDACPYHVTVLVDEESGMALGPGCQTGRSSTSKSFVSWPASVRRYLRDQNALLAEPPSPFPGCAGPGATDAPVISHPPEGEEVLLIPGLPREAQEVAFEAESASGTSQLSWFVDGKFVGTASADERVWWAPAPGVHEVLVQDEHGASGRRALAVRER
jgi:penicillin-binding protein 1C